MHSTIGKCFTHESSLSLSSMSCFSEGITYDISVSAVMYSHVSHVAWHQC